MAADLGVTFSRQRQPTHGNPTRRTRRKKKPNLPLLSPLKSYEGPLWANSNEPPEGEGVQVTQCTEFSLPGVGKRGTESGSRGANAKHPAGTPPGGRTKTISLSRDLQPWGGRSSLESLPDPVTTTSTASQQQAHPKAGHSSSICTSFHHDFVHKGNHSPKPRVITEPQSLGAV